MARERIVERRVVIAALAGLFMVTSVFPQGASPTSPTTVRRPGAVRGTVLSSEGAPIGAAIVSVRGVVGLSVVADPDGSFTLASVPAGRQDIEARANGYFSDRVSVEVLSDQLASVELALTAIGDVPTVNIVGVLKANTEGAKLTDRRDSAIVSDSIGGELMSKGNVGNAAEAVTKLPAVTVVSGKVYVRGLGERYSQTLYNNSSLPSPEPDRKAVPLDLFPAGSIESIEIVKAYSPDLPGEFAGGSVQIRSIDIPKEGFLKLNFGMKYNDGVTFNRITRSEGGRADAFTYDDGTRELPSQVPSTRVSSAIADADLQTIGRGFDPELWNTYETTPFPDSKLGASFGDSYDLGPWGRVGYVGALNWANKYDRNEEDLSVLLIAGGVPLVFNAYELDTSEFEAELAGLFNVSYELNPAQKIGVRNFATRTSTDTVRFQEGFDGQANTVIRTIRLRHVERLLTNTQIYGEHLLAGDTFLNWRYGISFSERDEPDNKQVRYDFNDTAQQFEYRNVSGSGTHEFYFLDEDVTDFGVDYALPFNPFAVDDGAPEDDETQLEPTQKLKFGMQQVERKRDFNSRRFRFSPALNPTSDSGEPIDLTGDPDYLFQTSHIGPSGFSVDETTLPTDNYSAKQQLDSVYALADFRLSPAWRIQFGTRVERSVQEVTTFELFGTPPALVEAELDDTDWMPAANLSYEFVENMLLRFSVSQTVSRPEFRELAAFQYTDLQGGYSAIGNPNLTRALLQNYDLRWEWFPALEEVISAGVFYKEFTDPIESFINTSGSNLITSWENAKGAELMGVEVELRKSLKFVAGPLQPLSINLNYAYIDSEVRINESATAVQTNSSRPLQGQPEYTFNAGIIYDLDLTRPAVVPGLSAADATAGAANPPPPTSLSIGVFASTFGERVSAVGSFGVPDEIEQPRWNLDIVVGYKLESGATIKIAAENLIDEKFEFKQGSLTTRDYRQGWAVGLSYSIEF
ncbi:MAG: TonB-dependent receptor domain-containing protein [Planctomycetota bacterium]